MAFRLRREAKTWFQFLEPDLGWDWDMYYFCLLAGLASEKKAPGLDEQNTYKVYDLFPGEYKDRKDLIIALFTRVELRGMGVEETNKKQTHDAISTLLNPTSQTGLSSEGLNLMNRYADYGYDKLQEWFSEKPRKLEAFLPKLHKKLREMSVVE